MLLSLFMKRSDRKVYAWFIAFIYISALLELIGMILSLNKIPNNFLSHIDTLNEVLVLGYFYYTIFTVKIIKRIALGLMVLLILFIFFNAFFLQGIDHFNSYSRTTGSIFFLFLSLTYFALLFKNTPVKYLEREPIFWFNTGTLFYFAGTIFLFLIYQNVNFALPVKLDRQIYFVDSFFNILQNVLFGIGFICNRRT